MSSDATSDALHAELDVRSANREAAARLHREFAGVFGIETIESVVAGCDASLAHARIEAFVPLFVERHARDRLRAAARLEGTLPTDKPSVVFVCVHNAGRSQMAAGWLQHLAGDQVDVFSAGSNPGSEVNPAAVASMAEIGIDIADAFPKAWTDDILRAADVIVTMGCGDACPVFAGKRYEDWQLADPAGLEVEQVRPIRDEIGERVRKLIAELGVTPVA